MSKIFTKGAENFRKNEFIVNSKAVGHFVCGQSNGLGATSVVTNTIKYHGQNKVYDTNLGAGIHGNMERSNESVSASLTNQLIDGYRLGGDNQHTLISHNQAVGGRNYDAIKKGGTEANAYAKFTTDLPNIHAAYPIEVKCFDLVHGEADLVNPWATYRDNLIQLLTDYTADCKAVTGQTVDPIMVVSQISSQKVYKPLNADVDTIKSPLALLDVCRQSNKHFSCGPQYWCQTNGGADQYHLNGRDQVISGEYRAKVYSQVVDKGDTTTPTATLVKSAKLGTDYIDVTFDVPKPPLQFETDYIPAITDNGFVYSDGAGNTITGVTVQSPTVIRIQLSGNVGATPDLQYAWHNGNASANGVTSSGPRGTLCDSETATSTYEPAFIMRNYALAFRYGAGYFTFT